MVVRVVAPETDRGATGGGEVQRHEREKTSGTEGGKKYASMRE